LTPTRIDLDELLGAAPKTSDREILWDYVLKIMNRFYDDKEIWRRYGWALRLKKINPRKEVFSSVLNSFGSLSGPELQELIEDVHTLSRRLKNNGS